MPSLLCVVFSSFLLCRSFFFSVFLCLFWSWDGNSEGDHAESTGIYSLFTSLYNILNLLLGFRLEAGRNVRFWARRLCFFAARVGGGHPDLLPPQRLQRE